MPVSVVIARLFHADTQVFVVVLAFSMLFFWSFAMHADLSALKFVRGVATATGRITGADDAHAAGPDGQIFANHYEFSVAGARLTGVSYGPAQEKGSTVTIEYRTSRPADSRISGMYRARFGPGVLWVVILPILSGLVVTSNLRLGKRRVDLLRRGVVTNAMLIGRRLTPRGLLVRLEFEFTTRDGTKAPLTRPASGAENEANCPIGMTEPVLYDPEQPSNASMLRTARVLVDEDGGIEPKPIAALVALIIPALFVAANVLAAMKRFG